MSDFPASDNNGFPDTTDEESYYIAVEPKRGTGIVLTQEQVNLIKELIRIALVEHGLIQPAAEDE